MMAPPYDVKDKNNVSIEGLNFIISIAAHPIGLSAILMSSPIRGQDGHLGF
jgi:hypothetical protein